MIKKSIIKTLFSCLVVIMLIVSLLISTTFFNYTRIFYGEEIMKNNGTLSLITVGDVYMSPIGDDKNIGDKSNPIKTFDKAKELVNELKNTVIDRDIVVLLRAGKYYVDKTINFDASDSGINGHDVIYSAYGDEKVDIIGGKQITKWALDKEIQRVESVVYKESSWWRKIIEFFGFIPKNTGRKVTTGIYKTKVSLNEISSVTSLYENGEIAQLARTPNEGYFKVAQEYNKGDIPCFSYLEEDISKTFDYYSAQVCIWGGAVGEQQNNWYPDFNPITNIDFEQRIITLKDPLWWAAKGGNRYYIRGAREFLDYPGEFFYDKYQEILYYFPINSDINSQEIILPTLDRIININGGNKIASNITFNRLTIRCTKFPESATSLTTKVSDGMIHLENAKNISIKNCAILDAGNTAVSFNNNSQNNLFEGNLIKNVGLFGLYMGSYPFATGNYENLEDAYNNKNHIVRNNNFEKIGYPNGMGTGISIQSSGDNFITKNSFNDITRYGISQKNIQGSAVDGATIYGSKFDYCDIYEYNEDGTVKKDENNRPIVKEQAGNYDCNHYDLNFNRNNIISYNDLSDCMNDGSDGGFIESFGTGKGNIIEYNFIHDGRGISNGLTVGIYLDDASDYTTIRNNVVTRLAGSKEVFPYIIKGMHNDVYNNFSVNNQVGNIFYLVQTGLEAYAGQAGGVLPVREEHNRFLKFEKNVAYYDDSFLGQTAYYHNEKWNEQKVLISENNVLFGKNIEWGFKPGYGQPNKSFVGFWQGHDGNNYNKNYFNTTTKKWEIKEDSKIKYDEKSIFDDPKFIDVNNDNYLFQEDSPTKKLGIEGIDVNKCGTEKNIYSVASSKTKVKECKNSVTINIERPRYYSGKHKIMYGYKSGAYIFNKEFEGNKVELSKLKTDVRYFYKIVPCDNDVIAIASPEMSFVPQDIIYKNNFDTYREGDVSNDLKVSVGRVSFGKNKSMVTDLTTTCTIPTIKVKDLSVSANIFVDSLPSYGKRQVGLLVRYVDDTNFVKISYDYANKIIKIVEFYSKSGEIYENLIAEQDIEILPKNNFNLKVIAKGRKYTVYIDDVKTVSGSSSKMKKEGCVGLFSDQINAFFDDVIVA